MRRIIIYILVLSTFLANAQTITNTGSLNIPRLQHESEVLNNGNVIVMGGKNGGVPHTVISSVEIYNTNTAQWNLLGSMNKARAHFATVKLKDGNIMAIGGNTSSSCEVYDVNTNTWTFIDSMHEVRDDHEAILLDNGNVLVCGGYSTSTEIYDVNLGTWRYVNSNLPTNQQNFTLNRLPDGKICAIYYNYIIFFNQQTEKWENKHIIAHSSNSWIGHGAAVSDDGNILMTGGQNANDMKKTGKGVPPYNQFFHFPIANNSNTEHNGCEMVSIDNGKFLIYGLGNTFTAINTKIVEIYDWNTNTWQSGNYTFNGASLYSINKLHNGEILIAGGAAVTTPLAICRLISINELSSCNIDTTISLSTMNDTICLGAHGVIELANTQVGVVYRALIGDEIVSDTVQGGGTINISIDESKLSLGENIIQIKALKNGCNSKILANDLNLFVETSLIAPSISFNSIPPFCKGDTITLTSSLGNNIFWNTGQMTSSINVYSDTTIYAQNIDSNGCKSKYDSVYNIKFNDTIGLSINHLPSFCNNATDSVLLIANVEGGTWSGVGVYGNYLYPSDLPSGYTTIYYSYCNATVSRQVYKYALPSTTYTSSLLSNTNICRYANNIAISNIDPSACTQASLYQDGVLIQTAAINSQQRNIFSGLNIDSATTTTQLVAEFYFPYCNIYIQDTFNLTVVDLDTSPSIYKDTICTGDIPFGTILNSDTNSFYFFEKTITNNVYERTDTLQGNGDTLRISIPNYYAHTLRVVDLTYSCHWFHQPGGGGSFMPFAFVTPYAAIESLNHQNNIYAQNSTQYIRQEDTVVLFNQFFQQPNIHEVNYWYLNDSLIEISDTLIISNLPIGENEIKLKTRVASVCTAIDSFQFTTYSIEDSSTHYPYTICSVEYDSVLSHLTHTATTKIDKQGNSYTGGVIKGALHTSQRDRMFLRKYDVNGQLLWEKITPSGFYTDCNAAYISDIEIDNAGHIYISGNAYSFTTHSIELINSTYLGSNTGSVSFMMKLNSSGNTIWTKHFEGGALHETTISDMHCENDSTLFFIACTPSLSSYNTFDLSGQQLAPNMIIQIDGDGNIKKTWQCSQFLDVTVGEHFNQHCLYRHAYIGPKFNVNNCGNLTIVGKSNYQAFVAEFNPLEDTVRSVSNFPETHYSNLRKLNADYDANNNIYIASQVLDAFYLAQDSSTITYYSKYDQQGNLIWRLKGTPVEVNRVAVVDSQVLIYGECQHGLAIEDKNGVIVGQPMKSKRDIVLISLSLDGDINWIEIIGKKVSATQSNTTTNYAIKMDVDKCSKKVSLHCNLSNGVVGFNGAISPNSSYNFQYGYNIITLNLDDNCTALNCGDTLDNKLTLIENVQNKMKVCSNQSFIELNPIFLNCSFIDYEVDTNNTENYLPLSVISGSYSLNNSNLIFNNLKKDVNVRINAVSNCGELLYKTISIQQIIVPQTIDSIIFCDSIEINSQWHFDTDTLVNVFSTTTNCDSIHTTYIYSNRVNTWGFVATNTNTPLYSSKVYLIKLNVIDSTVLAIDSTITDMQGRFTFNDIVPYQYVKAIPSSFHSSHQIPTYYTSSALITQADKVGCNNPIYFRTLPGASSVGAGFISGYIGNGAGKNNEIGEPLSNLNLLLISADSSKILQHTQTNNFGYFEFKDLTCSEYFIWVDDWTTQNHLADKISLKDNCEQDSLIFQLQGRKLKVLTKTVGVREVDQENTFFNISPNPTSTSFIISPVNYDEEYVIDVVNSFGKVVFKEKVKNNIKISTLHWNNGVYFILLKDVKGTIIEQQKLLKE